MDLHQLELNMSLRQHKRYTFRKMTRSTTNFMGFKTFTWTLYSSNPIPKK